MTDGQTDGIIIMLSHTLAMRESHVVSLIKFCPMVQEIA